MYMIIRCMRSLVSLLLLFTLSTSQAWAQSGDQPRTLSGDQVVPVEFYYGIWQSIIPKSGLKDYSEAIKQGTPTFFYKSIEPGRYFTLNMNSIYPTPLIIQEGTYEFSPEEGIHTEHITQHLTSPEMKGRSSKIRTYRYDDEHFILRYKIEGTERYMFEVYRRIRPLKLSRVPSAAQS